MQAAAFVYVHVCVYLIYVLCVFKFIHTHIYNCVIIITGFTILCSTHAINDTETNSSGSHYTYEHDL